MRKLLLFILIATVGFTTACKDEDLTVTLVENGNLQLTLVDNNDNLIADAKVTLYDESSELEELTTTENGLADFGKLNVGSYNAVVEATVNGKEYEFSKGMQVVAGATKQYEANIESYIGNISLQFRNTSSGNIAEVEGLQVALLRRNDAYYDAVNLSDYLTISIEDQTSNANGKVIFEDIPEGTYVLIYHDGEELINSSTVNVDKDDTEFLSFYINVVTAVLKTKSSWSISSVISQNDGSAVTNDYVSVTFDYENSDITLARSGGLSDVTGSFSAYSSSIYFYWDTLSSWSASVEEVSSGQLIIEYYDYNLGEPVVMTLN
ncbi:MAG: hypothetical protein ABJH05_07290 [Fulvivirga sp.]